MLPPKLAQFRVMLVNKGYSERMSVEDNLLAELNALDKVLDPEVSKKSADLSERGLIVSQGDNVCPQCGRPF